MKESSFKFKTPIIKKVQFELNESIDREKSKKIIQNVSITTEVNNYKLPSIVTLTIKINEKKDGEFPENALYNMELEVLSRFEGDGDLDDDKVKYLLDSNAPALLLSYARPMIANTLVQAGLPPYHIPFINFTRDKNE